MNWSENIILWVIAGIVLLLLLTWMTRRIIYRGQRIRSEANPQKITIKDIDKMEDGSEFELYLFNLFERLGYEEVHKTTATGISVQTSCLWIDWADARWYRPNATVPIILLVLARCKRFIPPFVIMRRIDPLY